MQTLKIIVQKASFDTLGAEINWLITAKFIPQVLSQIDFVVILLWNCLKSLFLRKQIFSKMLKENFECIGVQCFKKIY